MIPDKTRSSKIKGLLKQRRQNQEMIHIWRWSSQLR